MAGKTWICRNTRYGCGYSNSILIKRCYRCGRKRPPTKAEKVKNALKKRAEEVKKKMQWWNTLETLAKVSGRLMLVGPPGSGKSCTAYLLLKNAQRLTITEGTAVEDLLGMFHLIKGETIWKDGPAARALRNGTPLILDEIDKYSPEIGSLFYALLDDDPQVTLPSGEHLKAKPGYKVIATSNANVSALPEAILDRMEAVIIAAKPHPDAMKPLKQEEQAMVASHYEKQVKETAWQWTGAATLRRMRAYNKFRSNLKEASDVVIAEAVFGKNGTEVLSVLATAARSKAGKEGAFDPDLTVKGLADAPPPDPSLKDGGWSDEDLNVKCANCGERFGFHTGRGPGECPKGGTFKVATPAVRERPVATYNGGKCPCMGECDSSEVGGYAHFCDDPKKEVMNICPKHIDEYLKAEWKTVVDLRPLPTTPLTSEALAAKK